MAHYDQARPERGAGAVDHEYPKHFSNHFDSTAPMQLFYLAAFLTGLLLGVYAMIRGVERIGTGRSSPELDAFGRPIGAPRMALSAPTLGAFATVFGVTGYLLWRYSALALPLQVTIGVGAAVIGTVVATAAVRRWATLAAEHDVVDERYLLQGHPAQVVSAIGPTDAGEIVYLVGGKRYTATAQSLDGTSVAVGTEVIIDRVEGGVAYVESWVEVEQRL